MILTRRHTLGAAALALAVAATNASGQTGAAHSRQCDRVGTTSITFGYAGGNLKPTALRIASSGAVRGVGQTTASARVSKSAVHELARRGWSRAFISLPTAPTHPTRNPDAARQFIELRSACGSKHVEYADGEGPPAFRDLYAQLQSLAGDPVTSPR